MYQDATAQKGEDAGLEGAVEQAVDDGVLGAVRVTEQQGKVEHEVPAASVVLQPEWG